jgi:hypothetical protein
LEDLKQNYEQICDDKKALNEELLRLEKPVVDQRRVQNTEEVSQFLTLERGYEKDKKAWHQVEQIET